MFDEIQKLIYPNQLSSFEYTKLEELLKTHTPEQILSVYKKHGYKPIQYISKVLVSQPKAPEWYYKEVANLEIDEESEKTYQIFMEALEEFKKWERE